jgi:hypothetical protein
MVQVVFGMKDWLAALRAAGVSPMRTARAVGQASHRDLTPRPAANALHEIHFRRIRCNIEVLVAGFAENDSADPTRGLRSKS